MSDDRRLRLWSLVVKHASQRPVGVEHICAVMLTESGVDGAAITVSLPEAGPETLYASDRIATDLAELALTLGEGPSVDARRGGPVLASDLIDAESQARWPMFAPAAVAAGVRAIFALPLQVGGVRLGVVDLNRAKPGPLSPEQLSAGLMLADTACSLLLDSAQNGHGRSPDGRRPERSGLQHPEVHQATGMIIAQLGVSAAVALVRLRAYAFANERRLRDVARDVVARRLRFDHDHDDRDG